MLRRNLVSTSHPGETGIGESSGTLEGNGPSSDSPTHDITLAVPAVRSPVDHIQLTGDAPIQLNRPCAGRDLSSDGGFAGRI